MPVLDYAGGARRVDPRCFNGRAVNTTVVSLTDFAARRSQFNAEAAAFDVWHGPNLYSDFLRKHARRPDPAEATTIGILMGTRVRAANGRKYPIRPMNTLNNHA